MLLKDVMTKRVQVVRPLSTIKEAAQIMKVSDLGPLPVCDGDRLVGMVTDRDITVGAVAEGKDPSLTLVQEVMRKRVIYAYDDQSVEEAAKVMEKNAIRRLIVLNRSKRLVGIVSLADIARRMRNPLVTSELEEEITKPSRARSS